MCFEVHEVLLEVPEVRLACVSRCMRCCSRCPRCVFLAFRGVRGVIILLITSEPLRTLRPGGSSARILVRNFVPHDGGHRERCPSHILSVHFLNPKRNSPLSESDRGRFPLRICKGHFQSEIYARFAVCSLRWFLRLFAPMVSAPHSLSSFG